MNNNNNNGATGPQKGNNLKNEIQLPIETTVHRAVQAPAHVFGLLAQLAMKHVEAYFSDLYHDATKVSIKDWTKPQTFFYAVGDCGTDFDDDYAGIMLRVKAGRPNLYKITYTYHPRLKDSFSLKAVVVFDRPEVDALKSIEAAEAAEPRRV